MLDDKARYGRVSADRLRALQFYSPLPLSQLFAIDAGSREYNESSRVSVLYAQSALLTHYFLIGDRGAHRNSLIQYLQLRSAGAPAEQAEKQAFGDVNKLQKSFFAYLHSRMFLAVELPLDVSAAQATVRTLSEAEALALRGDALARRFREAEARPLLAKARTLDPTLPLAAEAQGRLDSFAGREAEARQALAEAARLAPDQFAPHFLWAQESVGSESTEAELAAAEAALRRSLALNPSFAPAHAMLAYVLQRRGQMKEAFLALDKANTIEPGAGPPRPRPLRPRWTRCPRSPGPTGSAGRTGRGPGARLRPAPGAPQPPGRRSCQAGPAPPRPGAAWDRGCAPWPAGAGPPASRKRPGQRVAAQGSASASESVRAGLGRGTRRAAAPRPGKCGCAGVREEQLVQLVHVPEELLLLRLLGGRGRRGELGGTG